MCAFLVLRGFSCLCAVYDSCYFSQVAVPGIFLLPGSGRHSAVWHFWEQTIYDSAVCYYACMVLPLPIQQRLKVEGQTVFYSSKNPDRQAPLKEKTKESERKKEQKENALCVSWMDGHLSCTGLLGFWVFFVLVGDARLWPSTPLPPLAGGHFNSTHASFASSTLPGCFFWVACFGSCQVSSTPGSFSPFTHTHSWDRHLCTACICFQRFLPSPVSSRTACAHTCLASCLLWRGLRSLLAAHSFTVFCCLDSVAWQHYAACTTFYQPAGWLFFSLRYTLILTTCLVCTPPSHTFTPWRFLMPF